MQDKLSAKENVIQIVKFTLFSISAGIIELITFTLLNELLRLEYWLSYFIALILSVIYNFTLNRRYTFKSVTNIPKAMLLVGLFYLMFTPYSTWLVHYLTGLNWNEYLVVFINMAQNLILEYLWCRFVIYRKSMNTNSLARKGEAR